MTSYVLLALLSASPEMAIDGFDITYAIPIVNWLVKQQNAFGGFSSTQVEKNPLISFMRRSSTPYLLLKTHFSSLLIRTPWWPSRLWLSTLLSPTKRRAHLQ